MIDLTQSELAFLTLLQSKFDKITIKGEFAFSVNDGRGLSAIVGSAQVGHSVALMADMVSALGIFSPKDPAALSQCLITRGISDAFHGNRACRIQGDQALFSP